MEIPINCPICNDILCSEFDDHYRIKSTTIRKICNKKINHNYKLISFDRDSIYEIELIIPHFKKIKFIWRFINNSLYYCESPIKKLGSLVTYLPFFIPDFSNFPKLISRLKTCLLFN